MNHRCTSVPSDVTTASINGGNAKQRDLLSNGDCAFLLTDLSCGCWPSDLSLVMRYARSVGHCCSGLQAELHGACCNVATLSCKLQAQGEMQTQQNLALTIRLQSLQTQLQAVQGDSSSSQSVAEEQQGLLLAAQRKLYTQRSRLIDSMELLRREVESLAVEQTLQVG